MAKPKSDPKASVRGDYKVFLQSPGGKDFLRMYEELERSLIVQSMKQPDAVQQARLINQLAGATMVRDYILRLSKPPEGK